MPRIKLPINVDPYQNFDEIVADGRVSVRLVDGYTDDLKATNKRPGLSEFVNITVGGLAHGLKYWPEKDVMIAVINRQIYSINKSGVATLLPYTNPLPLNRINFARSEHGSYMVLASGDKMVYTDNISVTQISNTNAPTRATHIEFYDHYILANNKGKPFMIWSDAANNANDELKKITEWAGQNYVEADTKQDNVDALIVAWRIIHLLGAESHEAWYDDGVSPFARNDSTSIDRGMIAPYSVCPANNTIYWLDHTKQFVKMAGASVQAVSVPFDKVFASFYAKDAIADVIEIEGNHFIILQFPTDNRTFVFDFARQRWCEWGYWDNSINDYQRWLGNCYCSAWGKHYVGSWKDGIIYEMASSYLDDAGQPINVLRRTGWIDHSEVQLGGVSKKSSLLKLKLKCGLALPNDTMPNINIRYRDDGSSVWSNLDIVPMRHIGDTNFYVEYRKPGIYTARQWEFSFTDPAPFVLVEAWEDVEGLLR